jgi:hypothetical protein
MNIYIYTTDLENLYTFILKTDLPSIEDFHEIADAASVE